MPWIKEGLPTQHFYLHFIPNKSFSWHAALIEICLVVLATFWQLPGLLGDFEKQVSSNRRNFYILSLTIVDLLVTGVLIPMRVAQNLAFYNNETVQEPVVRVIGFMSRVRNDCSLYFESSRAYKRSARGLKTSAQVSLCYKVRKKPHC